jgi:hypothetical protein
MTTPILNLQFALHDSQGSSDELQQMLQTIAAELEAQSAQVSQAPPALSAPGDEIAKGEASSSILDVKINLDTLKQFGQWLYERILGTTTEATFEYEGAKFTFKGRNVQDQAATMQEFEKFVATVDKAKSS